MNKKWDIVSDILRYIAFTCLIIMMWMGELDTEILSFLVI